MTTDEAVERQAVERRAAAARSAAAADPLEGAVPLEVEGRRALARLGGRITLFHAVAVAVGVLAAGGGGRAAAEVLALGLVAVPAVRYAGLTRPPRRGRHASASTDWARRGLLLRRLVPAALTAVVLACGIATLYRLHELAPAPVPAQGAVLAGWALAEFGIGTALAAGPLRGWLALAGPAAVLAALPGPGVAEATPIVGAALAVTAAGAVHLLVRGALGRAGRTGRAIVEARAARTDAERAIAQRRRTARELHDTVLATLTLLAHAGVGVPPEEVRGACRRDLALLGGRPPRLTQQRRAAGRGAATPTVPARTGPRPGPLARRLREVRGLAAGRGIDLRVHLQSGTVADVLTDGDAHRTLPDAQLRAWSGALSECVGNIARHAHVEAADVVLGITDEALVTVVVDEGVGFEPGEVDVARLGLAGSVHDRLREVGGRAKVWSRPGQGTVVELLVPWPSGDAEPGAEPSEALDGGTVVDLGTADGPVPGAPWTLATSGAAP